MSDGLSPPRLRSIVGRRRANRGRSARADLRAGRPAIATSAAARPRSRRRRARRPVGSDAVRPRLVIDRRYESDRWHGDVPVGDCDVDDGDSLRLLDPTLRTEPSPIAAERRRVEPRAAADRVRRPRDDGAERRRRHGGVPRRLRLVRPGRVPGPPVPADQLRERARAAGGRRRVLRRRDLLVTYNGKTFDVPVMETRWLFHRMPMPLGRRAALRHAAPGAAAVAAREPMQATTAAAGFDARARAVRRRAGRRRPGHGDPGRASSGSCAAAIRGRSSRCSSTTASTWCRWRR